MQVGAYRFIQRTAPPSLFLHPLQTVNFWFSISIYAYIGQQLFFWDYHTFSFMNYGNLVYFLSEVQIPLPSLPTCLSLSVANEPTTKRQEKKIKANVGN